nr:oxidoreductase [Cyanobacteria bacterium UBA8530]
RGPFGNGFPLDVLSGKDLLLVAGGLGIIPLRSMIRYAVDRRRDFGRVILLLGCKTPRDLLFAEEYAAWVEWADVKFSCTVDRSDPDWKGNVGLITELIPQAEFDPGKAFALVIGPPVMYRGVLERLLGRNIPPNHIFLSLERKMRCGLGKCGHCQMDGFYTCQSGPVYRYSDIMGIEEAL